MVRLASGELEPLLPGYALSPIPLNMLIVPGRAKVLRVRLLITDLAEETARLPGISNSHAPC